MTNPDIPQTLNLPIYSFPDGPVLSKETDPSVIKILEGPNYVAGTRVFEQQRAGAEIIDHVMDAVVREEIELTDDFARVMSCFVLGSGIVHLKQQLWRGAEPVLDRKIDIPRPYNPRRGAIKQPEEVIGMATIALAPLGLYASRAVREHGEGGIRRETHHDLGYSAAHAALTLWSVGLARHRKAEHSQLTTELEAQMAVKFDSHAAINASRALGWSMGGLLTLATLGDPDSKIAGIMRTETVGSTQETQLLKDLWASTPTIRQAMRQSA